MFHIGAVHWFTDRTAPDAYLGVERNAFTPRTDPRPTRRVAMNHQHHYFAAQSRVIGSILAIAAVTVPMLLTRPANAAEASGCVVSPTSLDARLAAKLTQGPTSLMRFVDRTRMIYQLDADEAVGRATAYRTRVAACVAASSPTSYYDN